MEDIKKSIAEAHFGPAGPSVSVAAIEAIMAYAALIKKLDEVSKSFCGHAFNREGLKLRIVDKPTFDVADMNITLTFDAGSDINALHRRLDECIETWQSQRPHRFDVRLMLQHKDDKGVVHPMRLVPRDIKRAAAA